MRADEQKGRKEGVLMEEGNCGLVGHGDMVRCKRTDMLI